MPTVWIVHRDPGTRSALARLVGDDANLVLGGPLDRLFESVGTAELVLLGVRGDLEAELDFAHRFAARLDGAAWVLLAESGTPAEVERLFDALPTAEVLAYPPPQATLRRRIRAALAGPAPEPLSQRRRRDGLAGRFGRWFADLELPDLVRALDPRLAGVPLLVRGERGTGRALLARYVHSFGGARSGGFASVVCTGPRSVQALEQELAWALGSDVPGAPTICLEDVDHLPGVLQQQLRVWLDEGLPDALNAPYGVRWCATAGEPDHDGRGPLLDEELGQSLAGVALRIPPLRERTGAIPRLVAATAEAFGAERGERSRRFSEATLEVLCEYPWPGNVRELEAVIVRTLAAGSSDPVEPEHLALRAGPALVTRAPAPAGPAEAAAETGPAPVSPEPAAEATAASAGAPPPEAGSRAEPAGAPAQDTALAMDEQDVRRLVGAIAHEVRNPLVTVRTFTELLPERFDDPEFRSRFGEVVGRDVQRIERAVDQLGRLAGLAPPEREPVDVAALLEALLADRRAAIEERELVVLKELDAEHSRAHGDPDQLRFAFGALLSRAVEAVPPRGSLYLASRGNPATAHAPASVRVLLRLRGESGRSRATVEGLTFSETALEITVAEAIVRMHGGSVTVNPYDPGETLILVDLPAD